MLKITIAKNMQKGYEESVRKYNINVEAEKLEYQQLLNDFKNYCMEEK